MALSQFLPGAHFLSRNNDELLYVLFSHERHGSPLAIQIDCHNANAQHSPIADMQIFLHCISHVLS